MPQITTTKEVTLNHGEMEEAVREYLIRYKMDHLEVEGAVIDFHMSNQGAISAQVRLQTSTADITPVKQKG